MKLAVSIVLSCLFSGCLVELLMTGAVTADMAAQSASTTMNTMSEAQVDIDHTRLQAAVDHFYAEKETYPQELHELVPSYIESLPVRPDGKPFGYNPVSGTVLQSGDGPAPADYLMMEEIHQAINSYGTSTGYYPVNLDDLYPRFLPRLPRTAAGQPFIYNSQTGDVEHPDAGNQYARSGITEEQPVSSPVAPVNAVGSLQKGDLKDSNSLNKALDRMGY